MKTFIKALIILIVIAATGAVILHLLPSVELWLHNFTGWH